MLKQNSQFIGKTFMFTKTPIVINLPKYDTWRDKRKMKLKFAPSGKQMATFITKLSAIFVFTGVQYFSFFASMFCKANLT